jgi:NAD(P)H-dependent FMN reductase
MTTTALEHVRPRIAVIIASTRESRFAETVGRWFVGEVSQLDAAELDVIDLRELELPAVQAADHPKNRRYSDAVGAYAARVAAADGFAFVTPEFNHGYPAPLKAALDAVYSEWAAKPATFVSYGGAGGGIRAVEQLRQVLIELHVVPIRDAIALPMARQLFDDNGALNDPERLAPTVKATLDRLLWWALALRQARDDTPYEV